MNRKPFVKLLKSSSRFKRIIGNSRIKKGLCSGFVTLKKGESIGAHSTCKKEELLVIIDGFGKAIIGRKTISIKKGQVLYIPAYSLHDIKNTSGGLLKYLYITATAI